MEYTVFCRLTELQVSIYKTLCKIYVEKLFENGEKIEGKRKYFLILKLCF